MLSVDEKPHIQALERAQGWLKLPNGKAVTGYSHEYKRHGTTPLFATLNVATGKVKAGHTQRRRRVEFLDFMNAVIAEYPDQEIHVILDNLNTHKPKRDHWLSLHKNVHFHYTPATTLCSADAASKGTTPQPQNGSTTRSPALDHSWTSAFAIEIFIRPMYGAN